MFFLPQISARNLSSTLLPPLHLYSLNKVPPSPFLAVYPSFTTPLSCCLLITTPHNAHMFICSPTDLSRPSVPPTPPSFHSPPRPYTQLVLSRSATWRDAHRHVLCLYFTSHNITLCAASSLVLHRNASSLSPCSSPPSLWYGSPFCLLFSSYEGFTQGIFIHLQ